MNSSIYESVHALDLLKLTAWKRHELLKTEDYCLRQEVLNVQLAKTVYASCKKSVPRVVTKRRYSEESSKDLKRSTPSKPTEKEEEPTCKRIKENYHGPFSAEDFLSQENPEKINIPTQKDPILLFKDRLSTFTNCNSKSLARAGFVSTGRAAAKCIFRSKTKEFKAHEDPWKAHEVRCPFVKIAKMDVSKTKVSTGLVLAQEAILMAHSSV